MFSGVRPPESHNLEDAAESWRGSTRCCSPMLALQLNLGVEAQFVAVLAWKSACASCNLAWQRVLRQWSSPRHRHRPNLCLSQRTSMPGQMLRLVQVNAQACSNYLSVLLALLFSYIDGPSQEKFSAALKLKLRNQSRVSRQPLTKTMLGGIVCNSFPGTASQPDCRTQTPYPQTQTPYPQYPQWRHIPNGILGGIVTNASRIQACALSESRSHFRPVLKKFQVTSYAPRRLESLPQEIPAGRAN